MPIADLIGDECRLLEVLGRDQYDVLRRQSHLNLTIHGGQEISRLEPCASGQRQGQLLPLGGPQPLAAFLAFFPGQSDGVDHRPILLRLGFDNMVNTLHGASASTVVVMSLYLHTVCGG